MYASPLRDGAAALDMGGGVDTDYTTRGGLLVPAHATADDAPLAAVRELHPGTASADTDELVAVEPGNDEPDVQPGPVFDRVPAPTPVAVTAPAKPEPATIRMKPVPTPEPAPVKPEPAPEQERPSALLRVWHAIAGERVEAEVSKTAVIIAGAILLPVAVIAFALSFQMTLPLIESGGWYGGVAVSGPLFLDAAASAAAIFGLLSQHHLFVRSGRLLLVLATVLSVWMNMDGHALHRKQDPGAENSAALMAFGIAVPIVLAVLIHLFGTALGIYLQQKADRERNERQAVERAEAQRQQAERAEAERNEREAERQRKAARAAEQRDQLIAELPTPTSKGAKADRDTATRYGVAHQVHTVATLSDALKRDGWGVPSETTLKKAGRDVKEALGIS